MKKRGISLSEESNIKPDIHQKRNRIKNIRNMMAYFEDLINLH